VLWRTQLQISFFLPFAQKDKPRLPTPEILDLDPLARAMYILLGKNRFLINQKVL
jgi:hypothetical protein